MTYKKITGRNGDRWLKDGKLVKASEVPEGIKNPTDKGKCFVCGEDATHKRNVLGMIVELCDQDYFNNSYGAVAGLLKKKGLYGTIQTTPVKG